MVPSSPWSINVSRHPANSRQLLLKEEEGICFKRGGRQRASVLGSGFLIAVPAREELDASHPRDLLAEICGEIVKRLPSMRHLGGFRVFGRVLTELEPAPAALVRTCVDEIRFRKLPTNPLFVGNERSSIKRGRRLVPGNFPQRHLGRQVDHHAHGRSVRLNIYAANRRLCHPIEQPQHERYRSRNGRGTPDRALGSMFLYPRCSWPPDVVAAHEERGGSRSTGHRPPQGAGRSRL